MIKEILPKQWIDVLQEEFQKPYFDTLDKFVTETYKSSICFPPKEQIFQTLKSTSLSNVKVVLLGQDPYHGQGQAHGLSFSVNDGIKHPPSLKNIFKELVTDCKMEVPESGNLSSWAEQGVLLLNATLTVEAKKAGSHQRKGWEQFTDAIIKKISESNEHVVFLLWGGYAQKKSKLIDESKHLILATGHPSPLSANRGFWFGNQHFSKTNAYLKKHHKNEILW